MLTSEIATVSELSLGDSAAIDFMDLNKKHLPKKLPVKTNKPRDRVKLVYRERLAEHGELRAPELDHPD